jgi:hypothetical protein
LPNCRGDFLFKNHSAPGQRADDMKQGFTDKASVFRAISIVQED